jgi:hypothetical protein
MRGLALSIATGIYFLYCVAAFAQPAPAPNGTKAACAVSDEEARTDANNWSDAVHIVFPSFLRDFEAKYLPGGLGECAVAAFMIELHRSNSDVIELLLQTPAASSSKHEDGHLRYPFPSESVDPTYKGFKGYDLDLWKFVCSSVIEKLRLRQSTAEEATKEINIHICSLDRASFVEEFRTRKSTLMIPYRIELTPDHRLVVTKLPDE